MNTSAIKAVLGPTNTGKTHLAIERLCAHSSGAIGLPLRLLAREVYDKVCAIKGEAQTALITGEERIEPPGARYFCCTVEAMPSFAPVGASERASMEQGAIAQPAFVAIDEAQLSADRERGHVFTQRVLEMRGREETMILGSASIAGLLRDLLGKIEIIERPRFSTLTHGGPVKLSRLPKRSAAVVFSTEQVYAAAEVLRRLRGGAAVVTGALSPETRNKQVELFQNGDVDYLVATDAIGMGLNLDLHHVAFGALTKFDGRRKRRLSAAEMAQIAGRAGRHQRDGSFGTLASGLDARAAPLGLTESEIAAIEEHRFAPIEAFYWRNGDLCFDSLDALIDALEAPSQNPALRAAPEAIDLAVLKTLRAGPLAPSVRGRDLVRRFWDLCRLPDFRQLGPENHARFVARLWRDLAHGELRDDFVATRIAQLDRVDGDIDTLQGRIAAIRSWAYICQRSDWVRSRDDMAARARAVEARLSDALHARLTERFIHRRHALLLRKLQPEGEKPVVRLAADGAIEIADETVGRFVGLDIEFDSSERHLDRKMLTAACERARPRLAAQRIAALIEGRFDALQIDKASLLWEGRRFAKLVPARRLTRPRIEFLGAARKLDPPMRHKLEARLSDWLEARFKALAPLDRLAQAARDPKIESTARGLLYALVEQNGVIARAEVDQTAFTRELRQRLRRLGVVIGALDLFVPALLKPAAQRALYELGRIEGPPRDQMPAVIGLGQSAPSGYRRASRRLVRVDCVERILREAFDRRARAERARFVVDPGLAISMGLERRDLDALLKAAGFRRKPGRPLQSGEFGPPVEELWRWAGRHAAKSEPRRARQTRARKRSGRNITPSVARAAPKGAGGAFDKLAELLP